jgi:hypothetical protein
MKTPIVLLLVVIVLLLIYLFVIKKREGMESSEDMSTAVALTSNDGLANQVGQTASTTNPLIGLATQTALVNDPSKNYLHAVPPVISSGLATTSVNPTPSSAIAHQTGALVSQIKQHIQNNSSVIKGAFHPTTGQLNDNAILPIKNGVNMILTSMQANLTSDNMHQMLGHVVDLATTLKQHLPPPKQSTTTTK